jgi:hypothetical protein
MTQGSSWVRRRPVSEQVFPYPPRKLALMTRNESSLCIAKEMSISERAFWAAPASGAQIAGQRCAKSHFSPAILPIRRGAHQLPEPAEAQRHFENLDTIVGQVERVLYRLRK